ncbi:hypothetical protein [Longimicrobium sp.]|uniref:hypothetical protein n=1 Tax=Longimicrobium sp. TaxID=2029185 RepID=UPI002B6B0EA5|nr:hypothetical protein [Longimicrobium sp.]HSU17165.1 hypothetical protein [Longimicrobium sp.]
MRLTHIAAFAAVAVLAACQDSPTTLQSAKGTQPDLSIVKVYKPAEYAAHGIADPTVHNSDGPRMVIDGPCYPDDPTSCGGSDPGGTYTPPRASLDYFTSNTHTNNGVTKTSQMWTYSQAHTNMESMVLRVSYQTVGAQDWKGCGATPSQFDSDYMVAFGSPQELDASRTASYPSSAAFVWRISVQHTFTANYGYTVDGTNRSHTFGSSNTTCW